MKVQHLSELLDTSREVRCPNGGFISYRFLLESDGMGFSVHHTLIPKGPPQHWHYQKHLEACYCIQGVGELINLATGQVYTINPHTLYALDNHDDHTFEAFEEVRLISIFNPPCKGFELHNADGSYE